MPSIENLTPHINLFISLIGLSILLGVMWLINKILGDAIFKWVRNVYQMLTGHDDLMDWDLQKIIQSVHGELTSIRINFDADRAYVLQFHNGEEYTNRMPRWKITNTFDVYRRGVHSSSKNWVDIPATILWKDYLELFFLETLPETMPNGVYLHNRNLSCKLGGGNCKYPRRVLFFDIDKLELGHLRAKLEQEGVTMMIQTPIVSSDEKIVGILGIEYTLSDYDEISNTPDFDVCSLCNISSQIALIWEKDMSVKNKILKVYKNLSKKK